MDGNLSRPVQDEALRCNLALATFCPAPQKVNDLIAEHLDVADRDGRFDAEVKAAASVLERVKKLGARTRNDAPHLGPLVRVQSEGLITPFSNRSRRPKHGISFSGSSFAVYKAGGAVSIDYIPNERESSSVIKFRLRGAVINCVERKLPQTFGRIDDDDTAIVFIHEVNTSSKGRSFHCIPNTTFSISNWDPTKRLVFGIIQPYNSLLFFFFCLFL
mmetsp:Transcript_41308/g.76337  ORF Transcript_41308/g.76337 Transcript_41308/m.76337 type:complete len:217 (-) Transcript_41308:436-1086(-)